MITKIDWDRCDGCAICVRSCPTNVIRLVDLGGRWQQKTWKAQIAYPEDCHSCRLCAVDCHVDAITVTHELHIPDPFLAYATKSP